MNKQIITRRINYLLKNLGGGVSEEIENNKKTISILKFISNIHPTLNPINKLLMIRFINNNIMNTEFLKLFFLQEQRDNFFSSLEHSTTCPTCDRHAKIYKRKLSTNAIKFLTSLIKHFSASSLPIHYKDCDFGSRDYPALRWWGLAETYKSEETSKNWSGYWIPTDKGISFAKSHISIPKYVHTYNGEVIDIDTEDETPELFITNIIGEKFNYAELMSGINISDNNVDD